MVDKKHRYISFVKILIRNVYKNFICLKEKKAICTHFWLLDLQICLNT